VILCVTPNPALDRTLLVPDFRLGDVSRARDVLTVAGGKGLNVARVVKLLGGDPLCAGPLGGPSGRWFAQLAEREGLRGSWTETAAETRFAIIIADASGRDASLINEPGPLLSAAEWDDFAASVTRMAAGAHAVTFSGSVPAGPTPGQFAALLRSCVALGIDTWVDTSGAWLMAAASVPGLNIKVNGSEFESIAGRAVADTGGAALAASQSRRSYRLRRLIITLGPRGACLSDDLGEWIAHPPEIRAISSVGSGDAFLGALVLALSEGAAESEALRRAVAAGAANAMSVGGGRFDVAEYRDILARVRATPAAGW
jgi:1-phosphofructokinase family hexose kinase